MVKTGSAVKRYCAVLRMRMLMLMLLPTLVRLLSAKLAYFSRPISTTSGSLPGASNATEQLALK